MKIGVLGATGPSGIQVVKEALERGHEVTAMVRNPEKLRENVGEHDKLKVVKVDIYDSSTMVEPMTGQDAVLSCLGCPPSWFSMFTITFYTDTAKPIVDALRKASVTRFVFMSAWYTKYTPEEPFIISWVLKPIFLGQSLHNLGLMEDWMEAECQDIDYTSVRPPQLTNFESTGVQVIAEEGKQCVKSSRKSPTPRRDVAKFMLDITENGQFKKKIVAIMAGK